MKTEIQAREEILNLVTDYYNNYKKPKKEFEHGDRITYAARVYDEKEMINLVDSSLEFWLTAGRYHDQFERKFSELFNVKYVSLVNSGSSANLLAFMALTSNLLGERRIKRGDEVITVAAGFPTTVSPIIQYGAIPVFVDISLPTYNIDVSMLEKAISNKTKAVMVAHTLGNPFNLEEVKAFCERHNLWLVEDNCDALGSKYLIGEEMKYTGTIGDIGTSSFYPPHHMTMGEGGAVYTDSPLLNKIVKSMRDWGRDCVCPSGVDNICKKRFLNQYGELPVGYDHKYVYSHFGYNLKVSDMQAAVGVAQLDKINSFIERRKANFAILLNELEGLEEHLILPKAENKADPSWFGFIMTLKKEKQRNDLVEYLENKGIQTRNLFAGNIIKHPCFDEMRETNTGYRIVGDLTNTDRVMCNSFWVGLYPGMSEEMLKYVAKNIKDYFLLVNE